MADTLPSTVGGALRGRPPKTTADEIAEVALAMWDEQGYDEVPLTEVADRAGVTVRTVFRYFRTKSDVIWGVFAHDYGDLRGKLAASDPTQPLLTRVRLGVVESIAGAERVESYHLRLRIISRTPELQHTVPEYFVEWRSILQEWLQQELDVGPGALEPMVIASAVQTATLNALLWWSSADVESPPRRAEDIVDRALRSLESAAVR
ncbi:MAG: mycofactocin system transcriptional regulator [Aeromicrobium sp.]|nr:mycofactocin system transcriptional regulator [Aeromicrobium sp.]